MCGLSQQSGVLLHTSADKIRLAGSAFLYEFQLRSHPGKPDLHNESRPIDWKERKRRQQENNF